MRNIEIYNRDTDALPDRLSECIVYWKKGCSGSEATRACIVLNSDYDIDIKETLRNYKVVVATSDNPWIKNRIDIDELLHKYESLGYNVNLTVS